MLGTYSIYAFRKKTGWTETGMTILQF